MLTDRVRMGRYSKKTGQLIDRTTPTLIVNKPYSIEGNGGRKLVRLDNGWLVCALRDKSTNLIRFFKSVDSGNSWTLLTSIIGGTTISLVCHNNYIYSISKYNNTNMRSRVIDVVNESIVQDILIETQTALGECSLIRHQGTELHACWSSKNTTYPNSYNIRYCKGTINADGNISWDNIEQVTTDNTNTTNHIQPNIVVVDDKLVILTSSQYDSGKTQLIIAWNKIDNKWMQHNVFHPGSSSNIPQQYPSACVDKDGIIHVAWNRKTDIVYSKSIDGGKYWSNPILIGSSMDTIQPNITTNRNGKIFVHYQQGLYILIMANSIDGITWEKIMSGYTTNPSLLDNNILNFDIPLSIHMTIENHALYPNSVIFRGKWYE